MRFAGTGICRGVLPWVVCSFWALSAAASEGDTLDVPLPWEHQVVETRSEPDPRLPGAVDVNESVLTAGLEGESDRRTRLRYRRASYSDRDAAAVDFDNLAAAGAADGQWMVVLLAQRELHLLDAACPLGDRQFSRVYADLTAGVESDNAIVNHALLCGCGAPCAKVAVDR